ncbi:MAG: DEAD/DEAH box helicase [Chloroflexota bacterium]|nr:DEAD/DEAH box helicase [Chloroflexota bacterium]
MKSAETAPTLAPDAPTSFGPVSVSREVAQALHVMGYQEPTPVQVQCIPLMNANQDVVAQARTGTGKTASFGIPIVEKVDTALKKVQAIVLAPTRELAVQVKDELQRLGQYKGVGVLACYGGQPIGPQITALNAGAHVVVGTPGRVLDHLHRRTLSLAEVRTAVLDEADEMLDIGFLPDIERILRQTPRERQTALFSATMHAAVRGIVHRHLRSPSWVRIGEELQTAPKVQQVYYEVWDKDKVRGLAGLLHQDLNGGKALLFLRTQAGVDHLVRSLQRHDVRVAGIHGGMTQPQRSSVMRSFKEGKLKVLAATNVAARGLDIPEVSHVVNYDMPQNMEEYVHRIGRTARMEADGTAITFVTEWDIDMLDTLIDTVGNDLERGTLPIYD